MNIRFDEIKKIVHSCFSSYVNEQVIGKNGFTVSVLSKGKNERGAYNGKRYLSNAIRHINERAIYSTFLNEGFDFEPSENERGGIIVFSTDVNVVIKPKNKFINFLKQKLTTFSNGINTVSKIDKVASENELVGWTVGKYLNGRYTAKNGKQFGENSLSVEIIGVNFDNLLKIAEQLCKAFEQECVLLKDFSSSRVLFVNQD